MEQEDDEFNLDDLDPIQLQMLVDEHKKLGNYQFQRKQYDKAAETYSSGLQVSPTNINLLSNRAACYINMGVYAKALADTEEVLCQEITHEKCIFRKMKSLWGLQKYQQAIDFIHKDIPQDLVVKNKELKTLQEKSLKLLKQSQGDIDILEIMKLPKEQRNDVGEFKGPVKIAEVPGKGRGLLATEDIQMGQLIICSKALSILFNKDVKAFKDAVKDAGTGDVSDWSDEECCAALVYNNLTLEPSIREDFFDLYSGPGNKSKKFSNAALDDQKPTVALTELINSIVKFSGFKSIQEVNSYGIEGTNFFGLWILPSYINHSCIDSNAYFTVYGDVMLIRAVKDIKKDEEITIAYWSPKIPDRLDSMKKRKFECDCRACKMEKHEKPEVTNEIESTLKLIQQGLNSNNDLPTQVSRIEKLISLRDNNGYPNTNLALLDVAVESICCELINNKEEKKKFIEIVEKMHDVTANNCLVQSSVYLAANIFRKCWELQVPDLMAKWWKQVKMNSVAAFGSTKGLIGLGVFEEDEVKDFDELETLTGFQDLAVACRPSAKSTKIC